MGPPLVAAELLWVVTSLISGLTFERTWAGPGPPRALWAAPEPASPAVVDRSKTLLTRF